MKSISTFLLVLFSSVLFAQSGKLVLVGGGAESDASYSWSNKPYQWAIEKSTNKKVAIITYELSGDTEWLPDYFVSLGASEASNFEIGTSTLADAQSTYDQLIQYDVFFFKGGDQNKYYDLYQNSKVSEAIENKFTEGGVIMGTSAGMAILSKVFYSAEQSSLYPDEALRDMNSKNITLKNDFLDVLDGIIVDTHFAERGRFPRLLAFMGNWKINKGENLVGIGVDDKTALCIDENLNAIAFGTGAVSIYQMNDFNTDENKPVADDIKVTHLLNEMEYDLEVMQITSDYNTNTSAYQDAEKLKNTLYLSGSDAISHNEELLNLLIANTSGSIVLVSKNGSTLIQSYESYIQNNSDLHVISIETVLGEECQGVSERNQIRKANTMIIVDFDQELFAEFFKDDQTGQLLLDKMKRSESQVAFIGSSSALAGGYFCTNNVGDELNAYYGALEYQAGLGLLATTLIMPNTFDPSTSSYYENNTSAVLYGMISHKLGYGLYLNEQSYVTITPLEGENVLTNSGKYSAILVKNNSQMGDLADQKVNNSGYVRNVVGFDEMTYHLVSGQKIVIGEPDKSEESTSIAELETPFNLNAIWQEEAVSFSWSLPIQEFDQINVYRKEINGILEKIATLDPSATSFKDQSVVPDTEYVYALETTKGNSVSCLSEMAVAEIILEALPNDKQWNIYPNPVINGFLSINQDDQLQISILDLSGKILLDSHVWFPERKLDLTFLPNGSYLLYAQGNRDFQIHKLMIDHE